MVRAQLGVQDALQTVSTCTGRRQMSGLAAAAVALLVASGLVLLTAKIGDQRSPVTLESLIAQDKHSRHRGVDHVSSEELVGDIKKLLVDVESNIKYRREKRKESTAKGNAEHHQSKHKSDGGGDLGKNLDEVNHMMDGLQALASGSGSNAGPTLGGASLPRAHRGRGKAAKKAGAEQRLSDKLDAMSNSGSSGTHAKKPDKKKAAILAKMKALQQKIEGDFKKVTGFGKQAGYVPPPKIPQM